MYKNFFKHLKTVVTHKVYVTRYCFKAGLYAQGLLHDLSKFSPVEFFESIKYYQGTSSPIDAAKKAKGWSAAWLHHKGRNRHHYEYWQDYFDQGTKHLEMPFKYALEMVCDYLGAGHAYSGKDFTLQGELKWWENKKKNPIAMHENTFNFVDEMMKILAKENSLDVLRKERALKIYNNVRSKTYKTEKEMINL